MNKENSCPRCGATVLKRWEELTEEEGEVVKRLPAEPEYTIEERKRMSRWCTRCWFELTIRSHQA